MTAGKAVVGGFMAYVAIGISVAILNGISTAVMGQSVTGYLTESLGGISLFNSDTNGA